jgi:hypothetical protein
LFDAPQPQPRPNQPSLLASQRRLSHNNNNRQQPATNAVHNQRVAQILQAIGHQASSPVNANRITNNNNQFYASSAPSSSVTLNKSSRPALPPVPLFDQSPGSVPQTPKMMNAADVDLDDFTAFGGGASTAFSSPVVPSPVVPSVFDFSGSASISASHFGTVSPQDLLVQDPYLSTPNSAAFTALTSPDMYDSASDFDVSPNFGSADFEGSGDNWYSLFPQDANVPEVKSIENSPTQKSDDVDSADQASVGSGRRKSTNSPTSGGRHSSVSGVNARKRDKPLPPIIVEDPNDVTAMKRARNTLAARKSRERKAQRFDELEERIAKLEAERDHWKKIALGQSGTNAN